MLSQLTQEGIMGSLLGLYFDGRKDGTMSMGKNVKYHRKIEVEEYYVILTHGGELKYSHVVVGRRQNFG